MKHENFLQSDDDQKVPPPQIGDEVRIHFEVRIILMQ